jgi:hypothetical protein
MGQEIQISNQNNQIQTFRQEVMPWIDNLIERKALPSYIKSPEDAFMIVQQGRELGIEPATALNNIHIINGKINLSAILVNGLLQRNGVYVQVMVNKNGQRLDCLPIYGKDKEGKDTIIDWVTGLRFTRRFPDGFQLNEEVIFKYSDARKAGLTDKDVWVKWKGPMLYWRAFTIGADRVAADILMGANLPVKVFDDLAIDANGQVTLNIEQNQKESEQKVEDVELIEIEPS